ncbi:MAG: CDP-diacylglycerol--glycerol-3-phosphate 3-phosphatidyltransferase [Acetivibrionales bacterium]|jgi:CDP-diacylglycerol--glycerol-3-phosphate 3-phosphatidyltransferase
MNLPNKITLSRIFLVPVFMLFIAPLPDWLLQGPVLSAKIAWLNDFLTNYGNYIAAAIFVIAASTDGVDGYIARKRKLVTVFGKFLDPIADKLLVVAALIALVERNEVSGWAALIIIARELIVTGLRLIAAGEGVIIAASRWGKLKTLTQIIAIVAVLLNNLYPIFLFDDYAMLLAVIITVYSGYDYLAKNIKILHYND